MSDRLTPLWTKDAEGAFGESGAKGRAGEVLVLNKLREQSIPAIDFEEDKLKQVRGLDIQTDRFSLDVKANLHKGRFFIEVDPQGWLFHFSKTSNLIVHVDPDSEEVVWYKRDDARSHIRHSTLRQLVRIHEGNFRPGWMSRSWDDLFALLRC